MNYLVTLDLRRGGTFDTIEAAYAYLRHALGVRWSEWNLYKWDGGKWVPVDGPGGV